MKKHLTALTAALIACLFCSVCALADPDFSISSYSMIVDVLPDGSASVTENLIYEFNGEYNGILSLFDTDGVGGIGDFRVYADGAEVLPVSEMQYVPNTYTAETDGHLTEIRVYAPGHSDTRLFTYEYTLLDLAHRYEDAGVISRKFIGSGSAATLQNAVVTVRFPESCDIEAYVHGAMETEHIAILDNAASFGPVNVSSGDSVEMRLLFPASLIPDAPLNEGQIADAVRAEEAALKSEADRLLARIRFGKYIYVMLYALIFLPACLYMLRRYGVYGRLGVKGDAHRLEGVPAAFSTAATEGAADTDALSGTLLELTQAGLIRMDAADGDLLFTRTDAPCSGLMAHQQAVIDWLFEGRTSFLLGSLNAGEDYEQAQRFEQGYSRYLHAVGQDMIQSGHKFRNEGMRILLNALVILLGLAGTSFILVADTNLPLGLIMLALLSLMLVLTSKMRLLTDSGERIRLDADALRSQGAPESIPLALLPHYAALALTDPLIVRTEENLDADASRTPCLYADWYHGIHRISSAMRESHLHNASLPDPNASSSHSGGSSNGGGGGHGAW